MLRMEDVRGTGPSSFDCDNESLIPENECAREISGCDADCTGVVGKEDRPATPEASWIVRSAQSHNRRTDYRLTDTLEGRGCE